MLAPEFTPADGTSGYSGITVSFDLNATGQAERNLTVLYTLNDLASTVVWELATITSAGTLATLENNSTSPNTGIGNYVELSGAGTGWNNGITATLGADANNDPNLSVEIVNASTGADCVNTSGVALNNSSGNWRFDNIVITGVPEPTTLALAGCGFATLIGLLRLKKRQA